jgi:hypothetical protein
MLLIYSSHHQAKVSFGVIVGSTQHEVGMIDACASQTLQELTVDIRIDR